VEAEQSLLRTAANLAVKTLAPRLTNVGVDAGKTETGVNSALNTAFGLQTLLLTAATTPKYWSLGYWQERLAATVPATEGDATSVVSEGGNEVKGGLIKVVRGASQLVANLLRGLTTETTAATH
jgi:hypothetical protein